MNPAETQAKDKAGIILISGFLGAGKTTLLKQLLSWETDLADMVVLVNEFGKVGLDGALLKDSGTDIIELTSGCICCSLSADLIQSLISIRQRFNPRRIFIESSGVADPTSIAAVVKKPQINPYMALTKIITVLDADFWQAREAFGPLFYNQLERADLILLNKIDLMEKNEIPELLEEIHAVIPETQVIPTIHCAIDPETLWIEAKPKTPALKPIQFYQAGSNRILDSAGHQSSPQENADHRVNATHYVTFSFQSSNILDEACFHKFIRNLPWELFRIKGPVRFADRVALLNFVGGQCEWTTWDGEPETQLVFIGWGLNETETLKNLKKCMVDA